MRLVHLFDVWRKVEGETTLGEDSTERVLFREGLLGFFVVQKVTQQNDETAESVQVDLPCIYTLHDMPVIKGDEIRNVRWRNERPLKSGKFEVLSAESPESSSQFIKHSMLVMKEVK